MVKYPFKSVLCVLFQIVCIFTKHPSALIRSFSACAVLNQCTRYLSIVVAYYNLRERQLATSMNQAFPQFNSHAKVQQLQSCKAPKLRVSIVVLVQSAETTRRDSTQDLHQMWSRKTGTEFSSVIPSTILCHPLIAQASVVRRRVKTTCHPDFQVSTMLRSTE
jgi:hypothetical protein